MRARLVRIGVPAFIALWVIVAFAPGLGGRFLRWDDNRFVTESPLVHASWQNLRAAFGAVHFEAYHPLHLVSYMLDDALFGRWAPGYHAMSLGLWVLALWALFGLMRRLGLGTLGALGATLLVGAHPLQAEAVSWISGRKDVLALGLFCAAAWLAVGAARLRSARMGAAVAVYALALLSKTSVVMLPAFLLLCDRVVLGRRTREAAARSVPFVVLAAVAAIPVLTIWRDAEMVRPQPPGGLAGTLAEVGHTIVHHLSKIVWPVRLSALYPVDREPHLDGVALVGLTVLAAALGSLWLGRLGRARLGTVWFGVSLLPVSNLVPMVYFVADRYASLTLLAAGWLVGLAIERAVTSRARARWLPSVAIAVALVALAASTRARAEEFGSDVRLFRAAVRAQPLSYFAQMKLGEALRDAGDLRGSMEAYRAAIRLEPERPLAYGGLFLAVARTDARRHGVKDRVVDRALGRYMQRLEDPRGLSSLAAELRRVHMEDTSLIALDRALQLSPPSRDALADQARQALADGYAKTAALLMARRGPAD